jgi:hypothetical protein
VQSQGSERADPVQKPAPRPDEGAPPAPAPRADAGAQAFRTLLRARKPREGAAAIFEGAGLELERIAREPLPSPGPAARASPTSATDPRLLVGQGAVGREARVEFRAGVLAGASVHLVSGATGLEVRVAAPTELARQTLAEIIDRARLQMRSRGIVMRPGASVDIGSRQRQNEGREKR